MLYQNMKYCKIGNTRRKFRTGYLQSKFNFKDIYMLVHDCGAYGQFATAVHKGKVGFSPLEAKLNWEKVIKVTHFINSFN
jgi:hypothetical protein